MALTLIAAKTALYPFVDNGVCSTDSRVVARINEAQRRLHSLRAWLGVLARYSVTVSSGQFTLPSATGNISTPAGFGLESAIRVSSTTAPAGFLTNSVQAFLADSGDILSLNFISSSSDFRTCSIEGNAPERVEVTGKLNYVEAIADTDLLVIDDLDALKLMILALYREENNQLEMAQALEQKAVERLTVKTDRTLEAARRINYQTKRVNSAYGTLGYVRSKLALDLSDGLRLDDGKLVDVINRAIDLLLEKKKLLLSAGRYGVKDGLTLPTFTYISTDSATLAITNYQVVRLAVLSLTTTDLEAASKYEAEALKLLEEALITELETKRHAQYSTDLITFSPGTLGNMKAKLAFELPNGLKTSGTEFVSVINRAIEQLLEKKKLLLSAGRYGVKDGLSLPTFTYTSADSTTLAITNYQIVKLMVLSLMNPEAEAAPKNEAEALKLLEEALITELETKRHAQYSTDLTTFSPGTLGNMKAKLAFELPNGLKTSGTEFVSVINRAIDLLLEKKKLLLSAGRYGVKDGLTLPSFTYTSTDSATLAITNYQVVRLMVLSLMNPEAEAASKYEAEALKLLEEALITELETKRHAQYSTALTTFSPGTLGNMKAKLAFELPNGLKTSETEFVSVINRAIDLLLEKKKLLLSAGRYGVKDGLSLPTFTYTSADSTTLAITNYQIVKLMVLSLMNPEAEVAPKNEAEALKLLEEALITELETKRHAQYSTALTTFSPGTLGNMKAKLAFELPNGLKTSETEFVSVINRAIDLLLEKKKLLLSAGRYGVKDGLTLPTFTYTSTDSTTLAITNYQVVRLAVLSLMATDLEAASKYEAEALKLLEEDLVIEMESKRHAQYSDALTTFNPGTLGNMKARLAFDLPNGLKLSATELSNLLNTAEEALFARGSWFGTIEHYKVTITNTNEILLPTAVGTILAVTMDNVPISIFDRSYDYHENGPGYQQKDSSGYDVLVDRGEVYTNNEWKRRYFVRDSAATECIDILAKKRWLQKTSDSYAMDIRNYQALSEMVIALRSPEPQISTFHENKAVALLQKELSEKRGGARNQMRIQMTGFAGEVQALI